MKQACVLIQKIWEDVLFRLINQMRPAIDQFVLLKEDIVRVDAMDLERGGVDILIGLA
ncbi:hypothetical protein D3C73_1384670 [compost metagenome]